MDINFKDVRVHAHVNPFGTTTFDIYRNEKPITLGIHPEKLVELAYPAIIELEAQLNASPSVASSDAPGGSGG